MKKGFTLIELLVVVLIIGILSAVALPQYTKTVERSRAAEALTMMRALADANRRYYLANGSYTYDIGNIDIEVPGNSTTYRNMPRKATKFFEYGLRWENTNHGSIAIANRLPRETYYGFYTNPDGSVYCHYYTAQGETVCKTFGGTKINSSEYQIN